MTLQRILFRLCAVEKRGTWQRESRLRAIGFGLLYRSVFRLGL